MAAAHAAVTVLADAIEASGNEDPASTARAFADRSFATALGTIAIDPRTQHASLPVLLGRIDGGGFDILEESRGCVAPDPYLSRYDPAATFSRPALRVVR